MTWHGENQRHSKVQRKGELKDTLREPMVPVKSIDLMEEARKYKTLDGFIKAQGDTLYHGTPFEFETFKNKTTFFTIHKSFAEKIAGEQTDNIINETDSDDYYPRIIEAYGKDLNLWDINNQAHYNLLIRKLPEKVRTMNYYLGGSSEISKLEFVDCVKSDPKNTWGLLEGTARDIIKSEGFDGWKGMEKGRESIGIFDPSKLKTKDDLVDIWNKAHGKITTKQKNQKILLSTFDKEELEDRIGGDPRRSPENNLTFGQMERIGKALEYYLQKNNIPIEEIYFTGSRVKGYARPDSDLDIMAIVKDKHLWNSPQEYTALNKKIEADIKPLEEEHGMKIELLLGKTIEDFGFGQDWNARYGYFAHFKT